MAKVLQRMRGNRRIVPGMPGSTGAAVLPVSDPSRPAGPARDVVARRPRRRSSRDLPLSAEPRCIVHVRSRWPTPTCRASPARRSRPPSSVDYPGVNEDVEQGAVPLSQRLRNPRTIVSIVVPLVVLLLLAAALPGFHLDQLPSLILNANPWWLLAARGHLLRRLPHPGLALGDPHPGHGLPAQGQGLDRDGAHQLAGQLRRAGQAGRRLPRLPAAHQHRGRAQQDLRHRLHRARLRPHRDRGPGPRGGLLELPRRGCPRRSGSSSPSASWWSSCSSSACSWCATSGAGSSIRLPVPHRIVALYDLFEEGLFSVDRRSLRPSPSRPCSSGPPRRCGSTS